MIYLLLLFPMLGFSQVVDSVAVEMDSVAVLDTIPVFIPENGIQNNKAILAFYQKLWDLEKSGNSTPSKKINIVHIGDSHIQADLHTNKIRRNLQAVFGNGGRGLIFPHNLARTNGSWDIRFSSNQGWQNYRNVSVPNGSLIGLSGIALSTKSNDFAIELNTKEPANDFNTIKIVTPKNRNSFDVAIAKKTIVLESDVPKKIIHKIKSGEAISIIADKYNVSIAAIKKANGLRSNTIRAGKTLKIPTREMQKKSIERSNFIPLEMLSDASSHYYTSEKSLDRIYLLPNKSENDFVLNGVILENDKSGIEYHNIGVNGAKLSDYNKYPMFFEQLQSLKPDLVVIALGTNESFDKMNAENYMEQLDIFAESIRAQNPNTVILVVTPPPSLFKRKYPNIFAADYAAKILRDAETKNYAVWDLYSQFGGLYGVGRNYAKGLIGGDRVHYTKAGYEKQGDLLSEAILKDYNFYKTSKK
jgi:LysM repeat protein/lysophospholipase L1-like esterase